MLGDGSYEEQETTGDEYQDVKSQEGGSQSQEELQDDSHMATKRDPDEIQQAISASYPQPGQPKQQPITPQPDSQERSYASLLQSSDKPCADQMDEADAINNGGQ